MTHTHFSKHSALAIFLTMGIAAQAQLPPVDPTQPKPKPEDTEIWTPKPPVVTPGPQLGAAPSDAIILFDGKNLDQWVSVKDKSPAAWDVHDGVATVHKSGGNIEDQTLVQELPASHRIQNSREHHRHQPGARQQRRLPRVNRSRG